MALLNLIINISFMQCMGWHYWRFPTWTHFSSTYTYRWQLQTISGNATPYIIRRHFSTDMKSNVVHARWSSSTFQPHCSRFWIIIIPTDGLVEEHPSLGLHVLPIWTHWIFTYGDILRLSCRYDTPVANVEALQNRIITVCEKIQNTPGFLNVFDNLCDVGAKHALMWKEIISSNFCKINKKCL